MSIRARILTIAAAGLLVGLAGCGSAATTSDPSTASATTTSDTPPTTSAPSTPTSAPATSAPATSAPQTAAPVVITIKDFKYTVPASVAPGAKITIKNADGEAHTVTSKGAFDVTVTGGGGTATFVAPTKAGRYPIACAFHANMSATLVVK